jgi:hypothetical protein
MSTKFEQLLDYLVNEEMDKANELFHEIVVEKSKDIYENLISEEEEDEEVDESADDEDDESVEEAADDEDDESVEEAADDEDDESIDEGEEELEDSYVMDGDDDTGDPTDDMLGDVEAGADDEAGMDADDGMDMGADDGMDMDGEGSEDSAMMDIKNAIQELEAAFAELEASQGGADDMGADFDADMGADMGADDDMGMGADDDELKMGMYEGKKRVTREYVEKVGNDWNGSSQKAQGKAVGADTGDKMGSPAEGKSPISSGKGKPTTGATAANILGSKGTGEGTNTGTKPAGKAGGFLKPAQDMKTGNGNVPGGKMGVKNLSKVASGHGAEKKGGSPGPVGSGSGEKAGQTSIAPETKKQFLKPYSK